VAYEAYGTSDRSMSSDTAFVYEYSKPPGAAGREMLEQFY